MAVVALHLVQPLSTVFKAPVQIADSQQLLLHYAAYQRLIIFAFPASSDALLWCLVDSQGCYVIFRCELVSHLSIYGKWDALVTHILFVTVRTRPCKFSIYKQEEIYCALFMLVF